MTITVAVSENDSVLLGADSAASTADGEIYTLETPKVFISGPYGIGFTTSYRMGQLLRYSTDLPDPPDGDLERFMATIFVDAVRSSLTAAGFDRGLTETGSILVGVRGKIFVIGAEYQVLHGTRPYAAVGAGRQAAYGALHALTSLDANLEDRAEGALRAAQTFNSRVREPFVYAKV